MSTFSSTSTAVRWIEVDKILDVRDEDVTEVVDEHPPPVTAGKSKNENNDKNKYYYHCQSPVPASVSLSVLV